LLSLYARSLARAFLLVRFGFALTLLISIIGKLVVTIALLLNKEIDKNKKIKVVQTSKEVLCVKA